jgi:helicase
VLHGLYRVAENVGKVRLQAAVMCPSCPASFKLSDLDLDLAQRAVLGELKPDAVARRLRDDQRLNRLAMTGAATSPRTARSTRPPSPRTSPLSSCSVHTSPASTARAFPR